jgi:hypothetical protein
MPTLSKACIAVSPVNGNPAASSKELFGFLATSHYWYLQILLLYPFVLVALWIYFISYFEIVYIYTFLNHHHLRQNLLYWASLKKSYLSGDLPPFCNQWDLRSCFNFN